MVSAVLLASYNKAKNEKGESAVLYEPKNGDVAMRYDEFQILYNNEELFYYDKSSVLTLEDFSPRAQNLNYGQPLRTVRWLQQDSEYAKRQPKDDLGWVWSYCYAIFSLKDNQLLYIIARSNTHTGVAFYA
jgi:hypothetical protein